MVYPADGFTWTPSGGRRTGPPTIGAVPPPEHHSAQPHDQVHHVIVIRAGYAGLVAARDLATQGKKSLSSIMGCCCRAGTQIAESHRSQRARPRFCSRLAIALAVGPGMPPSTASTTNWVELGSIGPCRTSIKVHKTANKV